MDHHDNNKKKKHLKIRTFTVKSVTFKVGEARYKREAVAGEESVGGESPSARGDGGGGGGDGGMEAG